MKYGIIEFFKRYKWIVVVAVCVIVCFGAIGWFGRPGAPVKVTSPENGDGKSGNVDRPDDGSYIPKELIGMFDTRQEAQDCANLYGIELVSYSYEVAVFKCEGNPNEVIEEGE